jgi:hypothetical protein
MGENRFDEAVQTAWGRFETRLSQSLEDLGDGSMVIEVEAETSGSGSAPYVQFAGDDEWVRGEVSSNKFLDRGCRLDAVQKRTLRALGWQRPDEEHPNWWVDVERDQLELLRTMTVDALRQALGVVHPKFLAWGGDPDVDDAGEEDAFEHELGFPESPQELRDLVDATIARHLGMDLGELEKDDDGDIPIVSGKVPLWIRVLDECPTVRIFSHVVVNVMSSRQARIECDILNRRHRQLKFAVEDRRIEATIDLPQSPFVAQHVRDMVDYAGGTLNDVVDDLVLRTNGRRFLDAVKSAKPGQR